MTTQQKFIATIATSGDGDIARPNGAIGWLNRSVVGPVGDGSTSNSRRLTLRILGFWLLLLLPVSALAQTICWDGPHGGLACGAEPEQCFAQYGFRVVGPVGLTSNESVCCYDAGESQCSAGALGEDGVVIPLVCPRRGPVDEPIQNCGVNCVGPKVGCSFETSGCAERGYSFLCPVSLVCANDAKDCGEASEPASPSVGRDSDPSSDGAVTALEPGGMTAADLICAEPGLERCPGSDVCFDPETEQCFGRRVCPATATGYECGGCITENSVALGDSCRSTDECRAGRCSGVCGVSQGKCVCTSDDDCGAGNYCYKRGLGNNRCLVQRDNGNACLSDKQCASGRCNWGTCRACNRDGQCPDSCSGGVCS